VGSRARRILRGASVGSRRNCRARNVLLVSLGLVLAAAVLLTLTCRLVTLWFAIALGWIAILVLRLRRPAVGVLL
jgi:thiamine transporter ThiT